MSMSKKTSKSELQKLIKDADVMEICVQQIKRDQSDSNKRTLLSDFIRDAQAQIKDERDVLLIAIKVK